MMSLITKKNTDIKIRSCRICLDSKCDNMVLLEERNGWFKHFEFCFGLTLTNQDEPRLLCKICAEKVQSFVKFKEKCAKSHSIWKSLGSAVKCCVVKHLPKASKDTKVIKIKEEAIDTFLDDDIHFSDEYETDMVDISLTGIKNETCDNDTEYESNKEENTREDYKDTLVRNKVDSNQDNSNIINDNEKNKTKKYTCAKCKEQYGKKGWYIRHIDFCQRKRSKKKRSIIIQNYAYDLGRQYFGQNLDKIKHESEVEIKIIKNENQDPSLLTCGLCILNSATLKDNCMHLDSHWSNNDINCKLCDFVGIDTAATMAHRYSHFPRNVKQRFLCHICQKFHMSLLALHFHYRKFHLKKLGGYCSRCNKEYRSSRLWKKHEMTHYPAKHICDFCGQGFVFKHSIRAHIINHMRVNLSICDVCGKAFTRSNYLKVHKASVHFISKPVKCNHCNRLYKSEHSLSEHLKRINREKPYECGVCHQFFVTPKRLRMHMTKHSEEKPYSCDLCGTSYKYKCGLQSHLLKHSGVLPQCSICAKSFASPMSLKRHSAVHTGVRRHACTATNCNRTFYARKLMLAHLESQHKNENVEGKSEIVSENSV